MKYTGGCHCGKVRYEVEITLDNAIECNCSICSKKGWTLAFTPKENFKLIQGKENLTDYQFNKHLIHHYFCKTCGISSFAIGKGNDGTEMSAINIRCLDHIELEKIPITKVDGKNL